MSLEKKSLFPSEKHDCYFATDPRVNPDLKGSLSGKNVVIAGAGRGVGRAIAQFITHADAATLTLTALEMNEIEEVAALCKKINASVKIKTAAFDVTNVTKTRQLFEEIEKDFGGVDILIVNAGRPPQWLDVADSDPEIWWSTIDVTVRGAFNFSRYAMPIMKRQRKGGCIILTSSSGAHFSKGMSSYGLGKLSLVRFAEILHAENFKEYNIKAFAFHPGAIKTAFYTDFEDYALNRTPRSNSYVAGLPEDKNSVDLVMSTFKTVTWDTPETAAGLVTVLASGKLDFMSGRFLDANVDIQRYIDQKEEIVRDDLLRVRLNEGGYVLRPFLDF
jgi:NAD(P)-dependent dehydrogenase (short-subunit alcohol dehydrogenase family)